MAPATSASAGGGLTHAVIGPQAERVANVTLRPWWERIQNRPRIVIAELSMSFMTDDMRRPVEVDSKKAAP